MGRLADLFAAALGLLAVGLGGCRSRTEPAPKALASAAPSVFKAAAPVASGLPAGLEAISRVVNPENAAAYSGPTGKVRGVVTGAGDLPPAATEHLARIKGACPEAREMYSHLFREGMLRSLGDVLVAVTGYSGYVPARQAEQTVAARGCAFSTRTIALTFGQTIGVVSKDGEGYVPNLLGSGMQAQLLALPGGAPSTLYPPEPGHYVLTDDIKVFMLADVFVLKYATHDVTSIDGRYEIGGIPVGQARISALLPATHVVVEKDIEIKADEVLEVPLELAFDAKAYAKGAASASAAASTAPKR